jgi:hypothetical protein
MYNICKSNTAAITSEEVVVAGAGVRGDHERTAFDHESVAPPGVGDDCSSSGCATTVAGVVGEEAVRENGVPGVNYYSPARST